MSITMTSHPSALNVPSRLCICPAFHNTTSWRWSNGSIVPNGSFNLSWRVTVDGSCQKPSPPEENEARQEIGRRRVRISSNTTLIATPHNIDVYTMDVYTMDGDGNGMCVTRTVNGRKFLFIHQSKTVSVMKTCSFCFIPSTSSSSSASTSL